MKCYRCFQEYDSTTKCPHCGQEKDTPNKEMRCLDEGVFLHEGRYEIGCVIGAGGFGVTYAAWDHTLQIRVAIKEYLPGEFSTRAPGNATVSIYGGEKTEQFQDGLEKFYEESKRLAKFRGVAGIVQIFDVFKENETAYIVMEYLEGETLSERLKREHKIRYQDAVQIMLPVLQALSVVHKENILHRDIAPNNIFLCGNGEVKLLDFGAARSATGTHSKSLTVLYKEGYTPEEQYRSRGDQGPWTDVYACAATLYRMVTGKIPEGAMERRRKDTLNAPSKCGAKLPVTVDRAIMNALNLEIKNRTQTAEQLMDELVASKGVKNRYKKVKRKRNDRVPAWIWGLVSVTLIGIGVFLFLLLNGRFQFVEGFANLFVEEGKSRVINVVNMEEAEAREKLAAIDLTLEIEDIRYSNKVEEGRIISQTEKKGELLDEGSVVHVVVSKGAGIVAVPDMDGRNWEQMQAELEKLCLEYEVSEMPSDEAPGYVCYQGIEAGTRLEQGTVIEITLSTGRDYDEKEEYAVENLVGQIYQDEKKQLAEIGIYLQVEEYRYDDVIEKGSIIQQTVAENEVLNGGDIQMVIVSAGLEPKEVPEMVGINVEEAQRLLEEQDLSADIQYVVDKEKEEGLVLSQGTEAGVMVDKFSEITIEVCSHGSVVPDFTGMALAAAQTLAAERQLTISSIAYVMGQEGIVVSQSVSAGSVVDLGSSVALNVGMGNQEGQKPLEAAKLLDYVNQYRAAAGVPALSWNSGLEQTAQSYAQWFATGQGWMYATTPMIGRQCNGAKTAERAVSDWISGNAYIPSEAGKLLNSGYTSMGGALYYLPNGGYKYYWVICFR